MKKMYKLCLFLMLFFFAASMVGVMAQPSRGGTPPSFATSLADENQPFIVTPPDVRALLAEDELNANLAPRAAVILPVDLNPTNSGEWITLETGETIWRLAIEAEGAKAITLYYSHFNLPKGSKLFIYNKNKTHILGAYTEANNPPFSPEFATEFVAGDHIILEYVAPLSAKIMQKFNTRAGEIEVEAPKQRPTIVYPDIQIEGLGYAYNHLVSVVEMFDSSKTPSDLGSSGACQVNINCAQGAQWQNQKKGVVATLQRIGNFSFICSGSLINNLREDLTPYILMAWHCSEYNGNQSSAANFNQYQFYFHWERAGCANTTAPITYRTMTGCVKVTDIPLGGGSDGLLLRLNQAIPIEWDVYYNGWDATLPTTWGAGGVGIHHPSGDVKKISTASNNISQTTMNISGYAASATNGGWNVSFNTSVNPSVTEGGSSGSPLFNSAGLIVGTLTGGSGTCTSLNNQSNLYGKMGYHYDRFNTTPAMKPYLDPDNTGLRVCPGRYASSEPIANFTVATQTPFAMQPVQFYSQSFNATSYAWQFPGGNPATSTEANPIVTYAVPGGPHSVTLTINGTGPTKHEPNYITVTEKLNEEEITIGTGTTTANFPLGYPNSNARVHQASLYTAAQLGSAGVLKSIAWHAGTARTTGRTIRVWMEHTNATDVTGVNAWNIGVSPTPTATLVAEYTGQSNVVGWNTWQFNVTHFNYNGTQNVIIYVEVFAASNSSALNSMTNTVRYTATGSNTNRTWYSNATTQPNTNLATNNQVPNIRLVKAVPSSMPVANFEGPVKTNSVLFENFDENVWPPANWTVQVQLAGSTWRRGNSSSNPFNTVDPSNVASAIVPYHETQNQDEWMITPVLNIAEEGFLFQGYVGYSGPWLVGARPSIHLSTEAGGYTNWTQLWTAGNTNIAGQAWAWHLIERSLDAYVGQNIKMGFRYQGRDGDLSAMDNLSIGKIDELGVYQIYKDELLKLTDLSTGPPVVWNWQYPGSNTPEVQSFGPVPEVSYPFAGTYDLGLTVTNLHGSNTKYMPEQLIVKDRAPAAKFAFKSSGYDAMGEYIDEYHPFFPPGGTVAYTDQSANLPDSYNWSFAGGNPATSTAKDVVVTYNNMGDYTTSLTVRNTAGVSTYTESDLVYVGYGPEDITNFNIPGGSPGLWTYNTNQYIAGSNPNWSQIAERYEGPSIPGQITNVTVYVGGRGTGSRAHTLAIVLPAANGGASGTVLRSINFNINQLPAQGFYTFPINPPVSIPAGQPFFIRIDNFATYAAASFSHYLASMGNDIPEESGESSSAYLFYSNNWMPVSDMFEGSPAASFGFWPEFTYTQLDLNCQLTLPATAGEQLVPVASNVTYTATTTDPWYTVTVGTGGVTVNYQANTSGAAREGSFTVSGGGATKTVSVLQAFQPLALNVTPATQTIPAESGTASYSITSNVLWTATCPALWVTITNPTGANNATLSLNVAANSALTARTAIITITGGGITRTVSLTQQGAAPYLEIEPEGTLHVHKMNGSRAIEVSSNAPWFVSANQTWINFNEQYGNGDGFIYFNFSANPTTAARTATILVVISETISKTLTVVQEAGDGLFTVNPSALQLSHLAGQVTVNVTSPTAWTASVPEDAWYSIAPLSGNAGTQQITVTYDANTAPANRSSEVTFSNGTHYRYLELHQSKPLATVSWNTPVNGTFQVFNGTIPVTNGATVEFNTQLLAVATPNTGHHLSTLTLNGVPFTNNTSFTVTENATFYVQFSYTLTLNPNGGSVTPTQLIVTYGQQIGNNLPTPTRTGYTFDGWFIGATQITASTIWNYTSNQTATARWTANTYTLTLNPAPGTVTPTTITVTYNAAIGTLPIPERPGYTYNGWSIGGTPITATTVWTYTANQTATTSWTVNTYTLTFNPSTGTLPGGTINPITVTYDQPLGTLPIPTQPNCFFMRWEIDGAPVTATTVWNYTTNKTAIAIFEYPIVATNLTPALGTLVPSGTIRYNLGATQAYVATPNPGHYVSTVLVDGVVPANFTPNSESSAPYTYTFTNINAYHSIQVGFARNCYELNVGSIGAATVTMSPAGCVLHGQNVTFTVKADCHKFQVKIGDQTFPWNNTTADNEVFTHTMAANAPLPLITVVTEQIYYTVDASIAPDMDHMGQFSPTGIFPVPCNGTVNFVFDPNPGYRVKTLYLNGAAISIPLSTVNYPLTNIRSNQTVVVEFEEYPYYIIQFGPNPAQGGGRVYPERNPNTTLNYARVDSADNYKFIIEANPGFAIDKVIVDGFNIVAAVQAGHYTFNDVRNHHTIYATFKPIMYTITATTDGNGTILPGGIVPVAHGASETFAVFPNTGYKVDKIFVNGVYHEEATNNHYYTFVNVKGDSTIHATFKKMEFTITATAGDYGAINPAGIATVEYGDSKTYTFIPNTGYSIDEVLINNVPNVAAALNGYHTFTNINQNHTIHVTFVKQTFTITSTATVGGTISPLGTITLEYGDHSPIYVIEPADGYVASQVLVDGENDYFALDELTYRFLDVTANHTIHVIFVPVNFTIVATASPGGVITPNGIVTVPRGGDKTFVFTPQPGYQLARVVIDGDNNQSAVDNGFYPFSDVMSNHTIAAQFEKVLYHVILPEETGVVVNPVGGSTSPVEYGSAFKFEVSVMDAYTQSNIVVRANNVIITPVAGIYTIYNITVDQLVTISGIEVNQYRIIAKAHAGGTMTPAGTFMKPYGSDQEFTITADQNYKLLKVIVNGEQVLVENDVYVLSNITSDAAVDVHFTYNLNIAEGDVSSITVFSHNKVVSIVNEKFVPVKSVEIVDMYGRVVWSGTASGERTDIPLSVATGIYGVRITTESNSSSVTKITIR